MYLGEGSSRDVGPSDAPVAFSAPSMAFRFLSSSAFSLFMVTVIARRRGNEKRET